MGDAASADSADRRSFTWPMLGGVLLALYLPPVFAIGVMNRWREVPRWLRVASVILSLAFPACALLSIAAQGTGYAPWTGSPVGVLGILTYSAFVLGWHRRHGLPVAPLLKLCFWFAVTVAVAGVALRVASTLIALHGAARAT